MFLYCIFSLQSANVNSCAFICACIYLMYSELTLPCICLTIVPCNSELQHAFVGSVDASNSLRAKSVWIQRCCCFVCPHPLLWWELTDQLTKREELSFFTVLAFPKDSRIGFACRSWRSNSPCNAKVTG